MVGCFRCGTMGMSAIHTCCAHVRLDDVSPQLCNEVLWEADFDEALHGLFQNVVWCIVNARYFEQETPIRGRRKLWLATITREVWIPVTSENRLDALKVLVKVL